MWETKYISCNNLNGKGFIFNLNEYLIDDTNNAMNTLRTQITSLNKKSLRNIDQYSNYIS